MIGFSETGKARWVVTVTVGGQTLPMTKMVDQTMIKLAGAHGGALSHQLLIGNGISKRSITRRVESGLLVPVTRSYFTVPGVGDSDSTYRALAMAYPDGAVARSSAESKHGFAQRRLAKHFVVPHGTSVSVPGVFMHETRHLAEADVVVVGGLRVTSPARTICDTAPTIESRRLTHHLETQLVRKRPGQGQLVACLSERLRRGVFGMERLQLILADLIDDQPYPESKLEAELFAGLVSIGLVGLERQFRPPWYDGIRGIVDIADPIGRTIIEADGRGFRQVTQAHDNDRQRDRRAACHNWCVVRVGHRELELRRFAVLSEIANIVIQRRSVAQAA